MDIIASNDAIIIEKAEKMCYNILANLNGNDVDGSSNARQMHDKK